MPRQTLVVWAVAACVLGSALAVCRLPHSGSAQGFSVSVGKIYGGRDATRGQFPYQVSLQYMMGAIGVHICGGSILTSIAVLTAGHCASDLGYYIAVAGDHDLTSDEGSEQKVVVTQQIKHPDYAGVEAANDIAVFILQLPLTLGPYVQPISLPSARSIPADGSTAVVSGWGTVVTASTPDILQAVDVRIIDYESCKQVIDDLEHRSTPFTDTMLCTGPLHRDISICFGDSGSPMVQNGVVIGVASWVVNNCDTPGVPPVFTRVSAHLDFINQNI